MNLKKMMPAKPPLVLLAFLELCRLIPPFPHFPDTKEFLELKKIKIFHDYLSEGEAEDLIPDSRVITIDSYKYAWGKIIDYSKKSGYEPLITKILQGSIKISNPNNLNDVFIHTNYFVDFVQHHATIRSIAENWNLILSGKFPHNYEKRAYYNDGNETIIEVFTLPFNPPINPVFTMDGRVDFLTDPFDKALSEIDTRRLRTCSICSYVFWAYQSNQKWCSAKCKRTGSKRKILANPEERARINKRRRENYQRSKKLNDLKENKNGTL